MSALAIPELLSGNPELVVTLGILLRLLRAYQTELSWHEYRQLHRLKRGLFPILDMSPLGRAVLLVSDKGGRDDEEFELTIDGSVKDVAADLRNAGGTLHLINSLKRRPDKHGDPLTDAHVVWTVSGGEQVEAYLFDNSDGTVDLYAHTEASVGRPLQHLTGTQTDGDTHGVIPTLGDDTDE